MSFQYSRRRPDDGPLREKLWLLAAERRRFGYRRLGWLLERQGVKVNLKKVYRLIARKDWRFAGGAGAGGLWASGLHSRCHRVRTSAGRWTSSPISWETADGSAF